MKLDNKGFALSSIVYSILILFILLIFCVLSILGSRKLLLDKTRNAVLEQLQQENNKLYKDSSGANVPELLDGMIPITYANNKWIVASLEDEWYNYGNKEWANAVVLKEGFSKNIGDDVKEDEIALWYVWIPRFKYTLFNTNGSSYKNCTSSTCPIINVEFEKGIKTTGTVSCIQDLDSTLNKTEICTDINGSITNNTSTYTHPAFTLGDKELTGFWIGKFETSGTASKITILPNKTPLTLSNKDDIVSEWFNLVKDLETRYNLNGDSHMIKNIEWGAVAYLKQSKYGLGKTDIVKNGVGKTGYGINNASTNYYSATEGMKASTTGNIYGVYDMAGGYYEFVMGTIDDVTIDKKYVDMYNSSNSNKLGDAIIETSKFYSDYSSSFTSNKMWYIRGTVYATISNYPGIFAYHTSTPNYDTLNANITTRAILTK